MTKKTQSCSSIWVKLEKSVISFSFLISNTLARLYTYMCFEKDEAKLKLEMHKQNKKNSLSILTLWKNSEQITIKLLK